MGNKGVLIQSEQHLTERNTVSGLHLFLWWSPGHAWLFVEPLKYVSEPDKISKSRSEKRKNVKIAP